MDSALVVHPDEPERVLWRDETEPPEVRAALAPPRLACEFEPPAPAPRQSYWRLD